MGRGAVAISFALLALFAGGVAADYQFTPSIPMRDIDSRSLMDVTRAGDTLVAVGERGLIMRSTDNGATWQQSESPVSVTLTAVDFPTDSAGWAVGHAGTILHSTDAGESWTVQFDGNEANSQWLAYARGQEQSLSAQIDALAAAGEEVPLDLEYALEDAGFNIEDAEAAVEAGPSDPMLDVLFTSAQEGWAVGAYGMIYRTVNGGESWQLEAGRIDNPDRYHYYGLAKDSEGGLYLSGEAGLLYHSHDGGENWSRNEDVYIGSLFGVAVRNGDAYTYGLRGNVFHSTDRGRTWAPVLNPSQISLYGGGVLDDGRLLMVGAGGAVVTIDTDGALTTSIQASRASLSSVTDTANGEVLVVGIDGVEAKESRDD